MNDIVKKWGGLIGKILVSGGMLWFVFSKIDIGSIVGIIKGSKVEWLVVGLAFFILSKGVSAYRLNQFFRSAGLHLPATINLRLYLLGMFYNLFLPGGIGGDAYKIIVLNRSSSVKVRYIIQATILDRVTGLIALLIITLLLILFLPLTTPLIMVTVVVIPLIYIVSWLILRRFFRRFISIFTKTNLQSAAVQLLQLGTALCILEALSFSGDKMLLMALFLISSVMAVLPVTFGGAGAREFTFAIAGTTLAMETITRDTSIALGMLFYLITALTSLAGIWYLFFPVNIVEEYQNDSENSSCG